MLSDQLNRAIQLYNEENYSEALTTILLSEYTEDDSLVYYYLGLCYIKLNDYDSGKENLEFFIELDDNLLRIFQVRMLLAYVSIQTEDYKEAQYHLNNLLESGYESAKLFSLQGYTYYKRGMISKCVKYYRSAVAIDPENSNALNALGYILADFKEDLKEAENLCRRALSIDVDNSAYLDSLGWVCFKNNKLPASQSLYNRALTISPENDVIKEHIKKLNELGIG